MRRIVSARDMMSTGWRWRTSPSWRRICPCPTRRGLSCPAITAGNMKPRRWHRLSSSMYVRPFNRKKAQFIIYCSL